MQKKNKGGFVMDIKKIIDLLVAKRLEWHLAANKALRTGEFYEASKLDAKCEAIQEIICIFKEAL